MVGMPGLESAVPTSTEGGEVTVSVTVAERELFVGAGSAPGDIVVLVAVDPEPRVAPTRSAALLNAAIAAGSVLLALIILPLTIGRITGSIRRVTEGAEAIAGGDLSQRIDVAANDETGVLADVFNRMAMSLKTTLGELRDLTAELEDRVRRRTADLEQANERLVAQQRDLEVERSLERLRTAIAEMEDSGAINELTRTVGAEMQQLGVAFDAIGINTITPETETMFLRGILYGEGAPVLFESAPIPVSVSDQVPMFLGWRQRWASRSDWHRVVTPEAYLELTARLVELTGAKDETDEALLSGPRDVVDVFFDRGSLVLNRLASSPFSDDDVALLKRFTEVFALGYRRYLDLQGAEERARQAEISRARQNVRTVVSSMERTEDIERVVRVLRDELLTLDIACDDVGVNIIDDAGTGFRSAWNSSAGGGTDDAGRVTR
jgi:HAMP domain-containing protein